MNRENLSQWLIEQCESRNLSWAEASRRAGVSITTISEIVNGTPAGRKRLTALAAFFDTSPEHLMRLAGYLPPQPSNDDLDSETRYRLQEIARKLALLEPLERERIMRQYLTQLDFALVLKGVETSEQLARE